MGTVAAPVDTRPARRILVPPVSGPFTRPAAGPVRALSGDTMGTTWSVKLAGRPDLPLEIVQPAIGRVLDGVIAEMSGWESTSALSRYNTAAAGTWHELPDGFLTVLRAALDVAAITDGAFDPTLGVLVERWGFGPSGAHGISILSATSDAWGWRKLRLEGRVLHQPGGLSLDLSGIAKGYAVDRVIAALQGLGLASVLVEIGGELRGEGVKADLSPWWVALEDPPDSEHPPGTLLALHGLSVATSGDYRRFRMTDGRRLSHTLDPRTGAPIGEGVAAVSVVHPSCMLADAWATALTVLGPDRGMPIARRHGVAARLLQRHGVDFTEICTPAFERLSEETASV